MPNLPGPAAATSWRRPISGRTRTPPGSPTTGRPDKNKDGLECVQMDRSDLPIESFYNEEWFNNREVYLYNGECSLWDLFKIRLEYASLTAGLGISLPDIRYLFQVCY